MLYGKGESGDGKWHMIIGGVAFCYPRLKVMETKDSADIPIEEKCENCDGNFRKEGAEARKVANKKKKRPNPKTNYSPRNKFKE